MRWPGHLAALMLSTSPAPAPDADAFLRWDAPAPCPSRTGLVAAIAADLGRPLAPADADALTVRATVRPAAARRFALSLTIAPRHAPAVERRAVAEDCALLAETAALMIAVAIDPERAARTSGTLPTSRAPVAIPLAPTAADASLDTGTPGPDLTPRAPAPSSPSPDTGTPGPDLAPRAPAPASTAADASPDPGTPGPDLTPRAPAPASTTPAPAPARIRAPHPDTPATAPASARALAPRRLRAALSAAAVLDVGALPRPAPGLLLRLGLLGPVRLELGALHLFKTPARIDGTRGGDLRLTAAQLAVCPRLLRRRLELPLCPGLELGAMRGDGVGLPLAFTDRVVWLALLADARLLWAPLPRLALGVQLGLAVPLLAARFRIDGLPDDLHRAAPVTFRGALALELRLP